VDALEFPVVVANVDFSGLPDLDGQITPYVVLEVGGESIGVIGVTRTDARVRPITGATFNADYAGVVQAAADELTAEGVNKIVVLSHLGYFADLELATQVSGVDVIVGGDTANLLSNTLSPDEYDVEGPYPAVVESASGETALVVQGWQRNRVLGQLNITFDTDGLITAYDGDSILISAEVEPDPDMEALLEQLRAPLEDFRSQVLGETTVELIGEREVCRFEECAMGNLIADALRVGTGAQIGLQNGGGIRASIPTGEITVGGILDVLPFGNTYTTFELSGEDLIAALENSVSRTDQTEGTGRFLQVSGLRFSWDGSQPAGSRVVSVEVLNDDGEYETLDPDEEYVIATNDYLYAGGDDYTMFAENSRDGYDFGRTLDELVRTYVQGNSPITVGVEGRITRTDR
jgi:5'-nucleotidase / UDP-sugar diphosphatase